jgi:N-formylglutamate amidohydrolase
MNVVPPEMLTILSPEVIERSLAENARVADWHTESMISEADQSLVFPFGRVFCDVERFVDDPLEKVGQGIYYTHTVDRILLRDAEPRAVEIARQLHRNWHEALSNAVFESLSYTPVVLIDMHSYSDFQADQTFSAARPDICLGLNTLMKKLPRFKPVKAMLERHGYSVAINAPYEGAIVPRNMDSAPDLACIMFEVHKRLYLDAAGDIEPRGFGRLQLALNEAVHLLKGGA